LIQPSTNKAAKVVKNLSIELWWTTISAAAGLGFSSDTIYSISNQDEC
jgi:hypothetical protein